MDGMQINNQPSESDYKIPLGLCKQVVMKLDSALTDLNEIREDEDLDPGDRDGFTEIIDVLGMIQASIINIIGKEIDEESFLNENTPMDDIDGFPGDSDDLMDHEI